ncbi:hypothetical protein C0J52_11030 [Blattella germanica]|nr:hypothetical protein C0J52_11030 [Blattella germanica]
MVSRNPNPPGSFGFGLSWRRATPEDFSCMLLRSEQQSSPQQKCILEENKAGLWNELLPRLQQLASTQTSQHTDSTTPDTRFGQDSSQPFRSAMYTLIGFVAVLLVMLVICLVLLKRNAKERERDLF